MVNRLQSNQDPRERSRETEDLLGGDQNSAESEAVAHDLIRRPCTSPRRLEENDENDA